MSDTESLEKRLREFAATRDDGADWEDVVRRAGERLSPRRIPRRRLAVAIAAAVVVVASVVGLLVTRGTRPVATGPTGSYCLVPTVCPPSGGSTGLTGPTGAAGPGLGGVGMEAPDGSNPWGTHGRQITIDELRAEAPYVPLPSSELANDGNVGTVWVWDHTSDQNVPENHVAVSIYYATSEIQLLWTRGGLEDNGLPSQVIDGVRALLVRVPGGHIQVGPTGATTTKTVPGRSTIWLPVGPDEVLTLVGAVPETDLIAVAQTLSPSPGDASPAGDLPPADPQPGPYLTFWDGFLTDGVAAGSVEDAAGSLAFHPVAPSSLGDPSPILETDPARAPANDRVLSLRYDDGSMGRFWVLERPSLSTTTSLLSKIASECTRATGCKEWAASMVDLGAGASALSLEDLDQVSGRIIWVEGGIYYEVIGSAGITSPKVLSVAKTVAAAAPG
jgi:hypothetical protein